MQSPFVVAFHLLVLPLVLTEQSQVVQLLGYIGVVRSQNLGRRSHISWFMRLTFRFAHEQKQQQMFCSFNFITATFSHLLSDLQSSFTKWLCFFVLSSLPIEHRQVVKCRCHLHKCGQRIQTQEGPPKPSLITPHCI